MSDVWEGSRADADAADPWMTWVPVLLYLAGAAYLLLGLGLGGMIGLGAFAVSTVPATGNGQDPGVALAIFAVEGVFILGICSVVGAANLIAGWGFKRGQKWAWFAALIIGAMYAPSACLPFGAALLYGCLNERTRNRFLQPAAAVAT